MKSAVIFLSTLFLILSSAAFSMDPPMAQNSSELSRESLLTQIDNDENKKRASAIIERIPLKVWHDAYAELNDLFKNCLVTRSWITTEELFEEAQSVVIKLFDATEKHPSFTEQDYSHILRIVKTIFNSQSSESVWESTLNAIHVLFRTEYGVKSFLACIPFLNYAEKAATIDSVCVAFIDKINDFSHTFLPSDPHNSPEGREKLLGEIKVGYPLLKLLATNTDKAHQLLIGFFESRDESREKISTIINSMVTFYDNDIFKRFSTEIFYTMLTVKDIEIMDIVLSKIIFLYKKCPRPTHYLYLQSALRKCQEEHGALTLEALCEVESDLMQKFAAK
jgi:hypothetical protein